MVGQILPCCLKSLNDYFFQLSFKAGMSNSNLFAGCEITENLLAGHSLEIFSSLFCLYALSYQNMSKNFSF